MEQTKRTQERFYLCFYLRVFEGDKFIGFLIDISHTGMMVMTESTLEEFKYYRLKMKLPSSMRWSEEALPHKYIEFTTQCRWSKHDDVDKEFYLNGFEFKEQNDEETEIVEKLIERFRIK